MTNKMSCYEKSDEKYTNFVPLLTRRPLRSAKSCSMASASLTSHWPSSALSVSLTCSANIPTDKIQGRFLHFQFIVEKHVKAYPYSAIRFLCTVTVACFYGVCTGICVMDFLQNKPIEVAVRLDIRPRGFGHVSQSFPPGN